MVLISYMSVPIVNQNGSTQYVKVDLVKNCVKINNHELESFQSMAEDAELFSSDDEEMIAEDDNFHDQFLPDYMKSVSRENMMHICELELDKLSNKPNKTETDAVQMKVLKMLLDDMHAHDPFGHSCCGGHDHDHSHHSHTPRSRVEVEGQD
jgi:hypothetical protein